MTDYLILIPVGYVLGSLPFGLVSGWAFKRVDVRDFGSGKTGMTNVLRTVGVPAAALVLLLDMGKAVLAVVLARIVSDSHGVEAAAALAALIGHNWPVFVRFRGGRGTAPGWGGLCILSPVSGVVATAVGIPMIAITRYVSLGSMLGAASGAVAVIVLSSMGHAPSEYIWFGAIGGTVVVARHKDNILRLLRGEERRLGQPAKPVEAQAGDERGRGH